MNRRPFTLVEVLVAVLVAAAVIPVALRALMTVAAVDESTHRYRQAVQLADLKLRELVVTGDWTEAEEKGDFGDDYPDFDWEFAADATTVGEVAMRRLAVTVHGPGRFAPTTATLATLVPEPEE